MKARQDQRMRVILARLELVSHGSATSYNGSGGGDMRQRDFGRPPGEANPPHEHYRWRYEGAMSDDGREAVISAARRELEAITRQQSRPKVDRSEQTLRERILAAADRGFPVVEVAQALRCLERTVRQVYRDAGRDELTGARRGCEFCGQAFRGPARSSRKWCDDVCKMRAARARKEAA